MTNQLNTEISITIANFKISMTHQLIIEISVTKLSTDKVFDSIKSYDICD